MNRRRFVATATVLITLVLSVGGAAAQDPLPTGERPSAGTVSIEATVNSRISYQGVLKESGAPVTGSRDMTFRFYSNDTCTTQVGSDIAKSSVQVTDGLFSVELDVTQDDFDGQGLWLEVEVGGTAIGCREILPVPYALSLRPGARIIGQGGVYVETGATATDSSAVYGYASVITGTTHGVRGETAADSGRGVFGSATSSSGTTYGVYGQASSNFGRGVYGEATSSSGETYGVHGFSDSTSGRGVHGVANASSGSAYGVSGYSRSNGGRGVFGLANASSGTTYGVYGRSISPSGYGVFGENISSSGTTYGVYGQAASDGGRAVYGYASAITGTVFGIYGETGSDAGRGVFGKASASSGVTYGVFGLSWSDTGRGVYGQASATSGTASGVNGVTYADSGRGVHGAAAAVTGTTYGVYGEASSDSGTGVHGAAGSSTGTTYGVRGVSGSADGYGIYGENSQGGYAGYFEQDVGQDRTADGLVKAAVYADCGTSSAIQRSFNNVQGTVTISGTATAGVCVIDWGFQVSDRFWVASTVSHDPVFVTCELGDTANQIKCACFDHSAIPVSESIMVLIY